MGWRSTSDTAHQQLLHKLCVQLTDFKTTDSEVDDGSNDDGVSQMNYAWTNVDTRIEVEAMSGIMEEYQVAGESVEAANRIVVKAIIHPCIHIMML